MVILIECAAPKVLLTSMRARITRGYESVWGFDLDGDFVYAGPEPRLLDLAVMRPVIVPEGLRVSLVLWKAKRLTRPLAGHLVELFVGMVVGHFSREVRRVVVVVRG